LRRRRRREFNRKILNINTAEIRSAAMEVGRYRVCGLGFMVDLQQWKEDIYIYMYIYIYIYIYILFIGIKYVAPGIYILFTGIKYVAPGIYILFIGIKYVAPGNPSEKELRKKWEMGNRK